MRPRLEDLVGEVGGAERDRLARVHGALLDAGAPPELPPRLAAPPGAELPAGVRTLPRGMPRRRLAATAILAAALALAAFGGGYLVGGSTPEAAFRTDFTLAMQGTEAAPNASAALVLGERDEAGNWPMEMTVRGLEELPEGERYELSLTRGGELVDSCGTFEVDGTTVVFLNAPYRLREYDGWAIHRVGEDEILIRTEDV